VTRWSRRILFGALAVLVPALAGCEAGLSAPGTAPLVRITGGAVNLPADTPVDLTGPEPMVVLTGLSSPLTSGSTVTMTFNFARAGAITMQVPVEAHAYEYATYSPPPSIPAPTPTKTPQASASPTATP